MFSLLAHHEEVDAAHVLRNQSKRAQKRLAKAEASRQLGASADVTTSAASTSIHAGMQDPAHASAARMYDEVFGNAPCGMDAAVLNDIARTVQQIALCERGAAEACAARRGDVQPAPPLGPAAAAAPCDGVDVPPGPGPGPGWVRCVSAKAASHGGLSISNSTGGAAGAKLAAAVAATAGPPGAGAGPRQAPGAAEEFPQLPRAAVAPPVSPLRKGAGAAGGSAEGGLKPLLRRNGGPHGARPSGVKVLISARPEPSSTANGNGLNRHPNGQSADLNLALLWELLEGGMSQLADPLAGPESGGNGGPLTQGGPAEEGPDAADKAAIRRMVAAQWALEDAAEGPARGVSPEEMINMMTRAHRRQRSERSGRGGAGGGGTAGAAGESRHYYNEVEPSRSWRRTVDTMKANDWVKVTDTDGKHFKYRRLLPDGRIQTQTLPCTPSDVRGVRNLQADLARKDTEANAVIRGWRRQLAAASSKAEAEAAAAAAADKDD